MTRATRADVARAAALSVATVLAGGVARADAEPPTDDPVGAEAHFATGMDLLHAGKTTLACAEFDRSMRLQPSPGAALKAARCRVLEQRFARALEAYDVASALVDASRATMAAARLRAFEEILPRERSQVLRLVPRVSVHLRGAQRAVDVTVNGVKRSPAELEAGVLVEWGDVVVRGAKAGYEPVEVAWRVPPGAIVEVDLEAPTRPTRAALDAARRRDAQRTLGIAIAGVGLGAVLAGGVGGLRTLALVRDSGAFCDASNDCEPAGVSLRTAARHTQTASAVAAAAGGVALGVGVCVWVAR